MSEWKDDEKGLYDGGIRWLHSPKKYNEDKTLFKKKKKSDYTYCFGNDQIKTTHCDICKRKLKKMPIGITVTVATVINLPCKLFENIWDDSE